MGVVDDVVAYLTAQGLVGGNTGWPVLRRHMTDQPLTVGGAVPDQLVVVAEDGGTAPEMKASFGIGDAAIEDPAVLVTVRGAAWDGDGTYAKAAGILAALHGLRGVQLVASGTTYLRTRAQTPEPIFAGFDDAGRPRHTLSVMFMRFV